MITGFDLINAMDRAYGIRGRGASGDAHAPSLVSRAVARIRRSVAVVTT